MAFFNVRSKLISMLVNKPTLLMSQYGIRQKQPKGFVFLLGSSLRRSFSTDLFGAKLERIPYSGKFCFVSAEKVRNSSHYLPEKGFRDFMNKNKKWGLLPSSDQKVTRVESIAGKIIAAMNDGLMLDKAYKINGNAYEPSRRKIWEQRTLIWKPVTAHLNGREWEFYVAECMPRYSYCAASGKLIISATLLDGPITPQQEAVIATLAGYEMGKVVAKSFLRWEFMLQFYTTLLPNCMAASLLFGVIGITDFLKLLPVVVLSGMLSECFRLRRNYAEASHIGLVLMASAGYDPRVAPVVYQHIYKIKDGLFSTHHSGDKTAMLLRRKEIMKEAIEIYEEAKAGKGVRRFV